MIIYLGILTFTYYYLNYFNLWIYICLLILIIGHIFTPFILNPSLFNLSKYEFNIDESLFV